MRAHLRAELIKLTTTRGPYALLASAVAVVALATWSTLNQLGSDVEGGLVDQVFFFLNATSLTVFAAILGARSATEDFRYGTVLSAVLSSRRRETLLHAKAVVVALAGAAMALIGQAVMTGVAAVMTASNPAFHVTTRDIAAMAGITVGTASWAVIGAAVGIAVRHQVAAVTGVVIWILAVENLGAALIGEAGRFLPGQAAFGVAGLPGLSPPTASLVVALWVAVVLIAARATLSKRDI
jgi:ABC-2 type transport system permease protein